jgi:hypothetical protein
MFASPLARAAKSDAIERLLATGKGDVARERCDRLQVGAPAEDRDLFEACATAFWLSAKDNGSAAAWTSFGVRFAGSSRAARARVEEAGAILAELDARTPEEQLLDLADTYRGTPAAVTMLSRAGDAAVRDARTAKAAQGAAIRYPEHAGLPALVEDWPDAFLHVSVDQRRVDVTTVPPVRLSDELAPKVTWVALEPGGAAEQWDLAARGVALDWGVSEGLLATLGREGDPPRFPLCSAPGQPPGWGPFVEVSVGEGVVYERVPWDKGCGPKAWPVFLTFGGKQVEAISLRPGHRVDLTTIATADGRRHIRGYLATSERPARIEGRLLYQETEAAWIVTPLSGGTPWATRHGPSGSAVSMSHMLRGSGLPDGWSVDRSGREFRVTAPALDKLPATIRDWRLQPGEIRVPPPLVAELLQLVPDAARPTGKPAPPVATAALQRSGSGALLRQPPEGSGPAGLYRMDPNALDAVQGLITGVGFAAESLSLMDGWKSDLDSDGVPELFIRAEVDGVGTLFAVDLIEATSGAAGAPARVFAIEVPRVKADAHIADMPYSFRRGAFVYLLWGGSEATGATSKNHFVEVVRFDGTGFVVDDLDLP